MHSMEHFATSRLTAERLNEGHLADLVALHLDPCVSRYLSGVRSPEATKTYLTANITHWDRHGFGLWVLRTRNGEFAGRAGIRHIVVDGASVEIAYTFKRALWGRGGMLQGLAYPRGRTPTCAYKLLRIQLSKGKNRPPGAGPLVGSEQRGACGRRRAQHLSG